MSERRALLILLSQSLEFLLKVFGEAVDAIKAVSSLTIATKLAEAKAHLAQRPDVILLGDSGIVQKENRQILQPLVEYCKSGGLVVMCLLWPSFIRPDYMDAFFGQTWGLPWRSGDYHRTISNRNPQSLFGRLAPQAPSSYSMKCLHLANVSREDAAYVPAPGATTMSAVFAPTRVDENQTPIAFTRYKEGHLAYVGDVNSESTAVLICMCTCLATSSTPSRVPSSGNGVSSPSTRKKKTFKCATCGVLCSKKCGRCKAVHYCSKQHQQDHWPKHKSTCTLTTTTTTAPAAVSMKDEKDEKDTKVDEAQVQSRCRLTRDELMKLLPKGRKLWTDDAYEIVDKVKEEDDNRVSSDEEEEEEFNYYLNYGEYDEDDEDDD